MKRLRITVGDQSYDVTVERLDDDGQAISSDAPRPAAVGARSADVAPPVKAAAAPSPGPKLAGGGAITSPMAGVVLSVGVKEGEEVQKDRVLLVLEAMKMENQIIAPGGATVTKVHVKAGESVQEGQMLVELE